MEENKNECQHEKINKKTGYAGFTASFQDVDRRIGKGEKQIQCPVCKLRIWETKYFNHSTTTPIKK